MENSKLSELYKAAREAKANNNIITAHNIYEELHKKDPDSWEGHFYSQYFQRLCIIADAEKNLDPYGWLCEITLDDWILFYVCISINPILIKNQVSDPNEKFAIFLQQSEDLLKLTRRVINLTLNCYSRIKDNDKIYNKKGVYRFFTHMAGMLHSYGKDVIENFGEEYTKSVALILWTISADYYKSAFHFCNVNDLAEVRENYYTITSEIKRYIPEYQIEELPQVKISACYIATCVYGSYDCPQVWTLRRFRDSVLDTTWFGKLFIKIYYTISPTFVKWFGNTKWFKKLWKSHLDFFIKRLNARGVEDTPYTDKNRF